MFSDGSKFCYPRDSPTNIGNMKQIHAQLLRSDNPSTTLFPDNSLSSPVDFALEKQSLAIVPRYTYINPNWTSQNILLALDGKIRHVNNAP